MIHSSWQPLFDDYEFELDTIYTEAVYPPKHQVFRAFQLPVTQLKVVLLGQDPYHGPGQADGLSFSVPVGQSIPPSLLNIFKELKRCFPERNYTFPSGSLEEWLTREHIFLCNASLTVEKGSPGSHMEIWKDFTDDVIRYIDAHNKSCVFLLLGNFAKSKAPLISKQDRIVTEVHPSPLARGFIGSNVFQRVETVLGAPINWSTASPYKTILYLKCNPTAFGTDRLPVTLDRTPPLQSPALPPKKQTRLDRMCEFPQTKGEEAVQIYRDYCTEKGLPITLDDINAILATT